MEEEPTPILTEIPRQIERRNSEISSVIILMHEIKMDVSSRMNNFEANLKNHMSDETLELAENINSAMNKAFPNADAESHKRYHEMLIERMETNNKLKQKLIESLSQFMLIGFISWAGYVLWNAFLKGPK